MDNFHYNSISQSAICHNFYFSVLYLKVTVSYLNEILTLKYSSFRVLFSFTGSELYCWFFFFFWHNDILFIQLCCLPLSSTGECCVQKTKTRVSSSWKQILMELESLLHWWCPRPFLARLAVFITHWLPLQTSVSCITTFCCVTCLYFILCITRKLHTWFL